MTKPAFLGSNLPPMRRVIEEVARVAEISTRDIVGRNNRPLASRARQMAMLICRDYAGATYPEIGRAFHRNHSTVMYNINRASEICVDTDWDDMEAIARRCGLVEDAHG